MKIKKILKKIKLPKKTELKKIKIFFKKIKLDLVIKDSEKELKKSIIKPNLNDLYRLYQIIILNKRTTILEFGSGYSSLIFLIALNNLKNKYQNKIKNLRRSNPFELFVLENEKKFLSITKKRIKSFNKINKCSIKINYNFSDVVMSEYQNKVVTSYKKLPLCNPDFIYLDGPGQFKVKGNINNISTRHPDMMPMVSDILKFEYFLNPGTIIVVDGRGANAKFLKDHFKRKWLYKYDQIYDQHYFYLNDPILGKYNKLQMRFYKS